MALSRNPVLLRRVALVGGGARDRRGDRGRRPRLGPVLEPPTSSSPASPEQHFGQLSGAGRHDFWRVAIDAFGEEPILGTGRRHLRVLLGAAPLDRPAGPRRPLALPGGLRRAGGVRRAAGAGAGRDPALVRLLRLARGARPAARALRGAARGDARLRGRRRLRLVLGDRRRWERSSSSPPASWSAPAAPSWRRAGAADATRERAALRARRRRASPWPGSRRSRWSARCWSTARSRPARARRPAATSPAPSTTPNTARSIEPWAASPYVQLGLLAELQGDYPTADERLTQAIDREDRNWQLYYLRSRVEQRGRRHGRRRGRPRAGPAAEPAGTRAASERRMTQRRSGDRFRAGAAAAPRRRSSRRAGRTEMAARLGLSGAERLAAPRRPAAPPARRSATGWR